MSNRTICDNCNTPMPKLGFRGAQGWVRMAFSLNPDTTQPVSEFDFCSNGCLVVFVQQQLRKTMGLPTTDEAKASA